MITEDYVSFETAKLLKEKGFDESCTHVCNIESGKILGADFYTCRYVYNSWLDKNEPRLIATPTLQMAMKWLRERKQIFIHIQRCKFKFFFTIENMNEPSENEYSLGHFKEFERSTYEETCDAAIKYCSENLI